MTFQCSETYFREVPMVDRYAVVCTYVGGHSTDRHSWWSLWTQDVTDAEARAQAIAAEIAAASCSELPDDVAAVIDGIKAGDADAFLEVILAAAHDRKRALRGTRGFPNLRSKAENSRWDR